MAQPQVAPAGGDVLGQHLHAAHQVLAVGGDGLAEQFRVGEDKIGRRDRVGDLPDVEARLVAGVLIQALGMVDEVRGPARGDEIGLFQEIEESVAAPFGVLETLVAALGLDRVLGGFGVGADLLDGVRPDRHIAGKEPRLRFQRALRVGQPVFRELGEGLDHVDHGFGDMVAHLALLARLGPGGGRLACLLDHARHVQRETLGVFHQILLDGRRSAIFRFVRIGRFGHGSRGSSRSVFLTYYHGTSDRVQHALTRLPGKQYDD